MYDGINAYGGANDSKGLASSLYFILLVTFGNCILTVLHLNFFFDFSSINFLHAIYFS